MRKLKGLLILVFALAVVAVFSGASVFAAQINDGSEDCSCISNANAKDEDVSTDKVVDKEKKENKAGKVQ